MLYKKTNYAYASYFPPGSDSRNPTREPLHRPVDEKQPRKPDWLLILVSVLFLITLLIAWLADIPGLFR